MAGRPRHEQRRTRQTRPVEGSRKVENGRVVVDQQASQGPIGEASSTVRAARRIVVADAQHDVGVLRIGAEAARWKRDTERGLRRKDSVREWQGHERRMHVNRVISPTKRPRGPTSDGEGRGGCAEPMRCKFVGTNTLEPTSTRRERSMRTEDTLD